MLLFAWGQVTLTPLHLLKKGGGSAHGEGGRTGDLALEGISIKRLVARWSISCSCVWCLFACLC